MEGNRSVDPATMLCNVRVPEHVEWIILICFPLKFYYRLDFFPLMLTFPKIQEILNQTFPRVILCFTIRGIQFTIFFSL